MLAHDSDPFPKANSYSICAAFGKLVASGKTGLVIYGEFISRKKYADPMARYRYGSNYVMTCGADRI